MASRYTDGLQEAVYSYLNTREQKEFISILNRYQRRRDVQDLVQHLLSILDTTVKLDLFVLLRKVIPSKDLHQYDKLIQTLTESRLGPRNTYPRRHEYGIDGEIHQRPGSTLSVPATLPHSADQSLPTRHYHKGMVRNTLPQEMMKNHSKKTSTWETAHMPKLKKILMSKPDDLRESLGFSIRGGAEHGIGIYVSYVDVESMAEEQGLVPGDQLLSVNGIPFKKIVHDEAAKIIKHADRLDMEVCNLGRVPGSFESHQTYAWVDPIGRSVSPPPEVDRIGRYNHSDERKSGLMLLKDSDERKVHLVLNDNQSRGLMIRGGKEFSLGIYITSIDPGSVAENAGLKIGDQLLDVNGQSFLDITHADAVKVIKSSRRMMLTVKDVGKLPFAQTTFDHTKWVQQDSLPRKTQSLKDYSLAEPFTQTDAFSRPCLNGSGTLQRNGNVEAVFMRGAGSQLMHSSMSNKQTQRGMLEEQARNLLNPGERTTMNYYLNQYQQGNIEAEALALALIELLNTNAKFQLTAEVRGLVAPRDLEKYDQLILKRQLTGIKSPEQSMVDRLSYQSIDSLSLDSRHSASSGQESVDELDPLRIAIEQIKTGPEDENDFSNVNISLPGPDPMSAFKPIHPVSTSQHSSSQGLKKSVVVAEVHSPPRLNDHSSERAYHEETQCPSEDSGVEVNGGGSRDTDRRFSPQNDHNVAVLKPHGRNKKRVTVSSQDPVVIRDHFSGHQKANNQPTSSRNDSSLSSVARESKRPQYSTESLPTKSSINQEERLRESAKVVTVYKLKPTLGIAIEGGANTRQPLPRIISIQAGGSADLSGGLEIGQTILELDGNSLKSLEHREVAKAIAESFKNKHIKHMDFTVLPPTTEMS